MSADFPSIYIRQAAGGLGQASKGAVEDIAHDGILWCECGASSARPPAFPSFETIVLPNPKRSERKRKPPRHDEHKGSRGNGLEMSTPGDVDRPRWISLPHRLQAQDALGQASHAPRLQSSEIEMGLVFEDAGDDGVAAGALPSEKKILDTPIREKYCNERSIQ